MSFLKLICKAAKIERLRKELELEKINSYKEHSGKEKLSLKQKYRHFWVDTGMAVRALCKRLFYFRKHSCMYRTIYKMKRNDTCENFTLKSVIGFIAGFFLTYIFFVFFVFILNFKLSTATIMCSFLGAVLTLGLAFSYKVRCVVFLVLPQFFSKRGRQALMAYAFILAITGPAKNTLNNMGILSESLACGQEQLKSAVKQILDVVKKPFYAIKDAIKLVVKTIKVIVKKIKDILLSIKRTVMALLNVIKAGFKFLTRILSVCNREVGTPFERCQSAFENAIEDCSAKLGPSFDWLCSIAYLVNSVCYVVKPLHLMCVAIDFINDSVIGIVVKKIKIFVRHMKTMFYVRIKFSHSFHFETNQSKTMNEITSGIITEIRHKTENILTVFDFMSCATSMFFLFIILGALNYRYKFLTSERFDNRFVTRDLREIDLRRTQMEKETVLPLNHRERTLYINITSLRLVKSEKLKLSKATAVLGMTTLKLSTHMMVDYALYWMLTVIRHHARYQSTVKAPNVVGVHVDGKGFLASLLRSIVKAFQPFGMNIEIDTIPCLPDPITPDYDRYVQIAILLILCWILTIFEPFGLRLRHSVMCYYYPDRRRQRAVWLYNHILRSRFSFLKQARRQLRRKISGTKGISKVTFVEYLRSNLDCKLVRLCLGSDSQPTCFLCGEVSRSDDPIKPIRCANPTCSGIYCAQCFKDLQNICTVCLDPIEYGDLSDVSEEKDSSEDDAPAVKPIKGKKRWKKTCKISKCLKRDSDSDSDEETSKSLSKNSDSDYGTDGNTTDNSYSYQNNKDLFKTIAPARYPFQDKEKQHIPDHASLETFQNDNNADSVGLALAKLTDSREILEGGLNKSVSQMEINEEVTSLHVDDSTSNWSSSSTETDSETISSDSSNSDEKDDNRKINNLEFSDVVKENLQTQSDAKPIKESTNDLLLRQPTTLASLVYSRDKICDKSSNALETKMKPPEVCSNSDEDILVVQSKSLDSDISVSTTTKAGKGISSAMNRKKLYIKEKFSVSTRKITRVKNQYKNKLLTKNARNNTCKLYQKAIGFCKGAYSKTKAKPKKLATYCTCVPSESVFTTYTDETIVNITKYTSSLRVGNVINRVLGDESLHSSSAKFESLSSHSSIISELGEKHQLFFPELPRQVKTKRNMPRSLPDIKKRKRSVDVATNVTLSSDVTCRSSESQMTTNRPTSDSDTTYIYSPLIRPPREVRKCPCCMNVQSYNANINSTRVVSGQSYRHSKRNKSLNVNLRQKSLNDVPPLDLSFLPERQDISDHFKANVRYEIVKETPRSSSSSLCTTPTGLRNVQIYVPPLDREGSLRSRTVQEFLHAQKTKRIHYLLDSKINESCLPSSGTEYNLDATSSSKSSVGEGCRNRFSAGTQTQKEKVKEYYKYINKKKPVEYVPAGSTGRNKFVKFIKKIFGKKPVEPVSIPSGICSRLGECTRSETSTLTIFPESLPKRKNSDSESDARCLSEDSLLMGNSLRIIQDDCVNGTQSNRYKKKPIYGSSDSELSNIDVYFGNKKNAKKHLKGVRLRDKALDFDRPSVVTGSTQMTSSKETEDPAPKYFRQPAERDQDPNVNESIESIRRHYSTPTLRTIVAACTTNSSINMRESCPKDGYISHLPSSPKPGRYFNTLNDNYESFGGHKQCLCQEFAKSRRWARNQEPNRVRFSSEERRPSNMRLPSKTDMRLVHNECEEAHNSRHNCCHNYGNKMREYLAEYSSGEPNTYLPAKLNNIDDNEDQYPEDCCDCPNFEMATLDRNSRRIMDDECSCKSGSSGNTEFPNLVYQNTSEYVNLVGELGDKLSQRNKTRVRKAMREFENMSRQNKNLERPVFDSDDEERMSYARRMLNFPNTKTPCYRNKKNYSEVSCNRMIIEPSCQKCYKNNNCSERTEPHNQTSGYVNKVVRSMNDDGQYGFPASPIKIDKKTSTGPHWKMDPNTGEWYKVHNGFRDYEEDGFVLPWCSKQKSICARRVRCGSPKRDTMDHPKSARGYRCVHCGHFQEPMY